MTQYIFRARLNRGTRLSHSGRGVTSHDHPIVHVEPQPQPLKVGDGPCARGSASMTQYIFRVGAVLLILWLLLLLSSAFAAHPPEHQAIHEQFYQGWMMPDDRTLSCCSDKDCAPVDAVRQDESGRWQARRESDGQWLTIPPQKIEYDRDSPDGRSHMCSAGRTVFCFILGNGS